MIYWKKLLNKYFLDYYLNFENIKEILNSFTNIFAIKYNNLMRFKSGENIDKRVKE